MDGETSFGACSQPNSDGLEAVDSNLEPDDYPPPTYQETMEGNPNERVIYLANDMFFIGVVKNQAFIPTLPQRQNPYSNSFSFIGSEENGYLGSLLAQAGVTWSDLMKIIGSLERKGMLTDANAPSTISKLIERLIEVIGSGASNDILAIRRDIAPDEGCTPQMCIRSIPRLLYLCCCHRRSS